MENKKFSLKTVTILDNSKSCPKVLINELPFTYNENKNPCKLCQFGKNFLYPILNKSDIEYYCAECLFEICDNILFKK